MEKESLYTAIGSASTAIIALVGRYFEMKHRRRALRKKQGAEAIDVWRELAHDLREQVDSLSDKLTATNEQVYNLTEQNKVLHLKIIQLEKIIARFDNP